MKKNILKFIQFNILLIYSTIFISVIFTDFAQSDNKEKTVYYKPSNQDFTNPERGLFIQYSPNKNDPRPPLKVSELQKLNKKNITLIRRIYLIAEFRNTPLSSSFLEKVTADLAAARKAGVKVILRFSYNWLGGGPDATKERILAHQEQLKPVLENNYDVIAFMEAGFIGAWGEWNKSTHGLGEDPQARKSILLKLLSILPPERMVAIRYTHHKREAFKDPFPLQSSAVFNRRKKARIGAHNDCFLASIDDRGTYSTTDPEEIARQKAFLQQDNLFVVQGGELCNHNPPQTDCPNALAELAQMRWSALNYYPPEEDLNIIFQDWQKQGCLSEISRRLGYRLRLIESSLNQEAIARGKIDLQFTIANDGWGNIYNPRQLEVILRHQQTGKEYYFVTAENPRFWHPNTENVVQIKANLPPDISQGNYQILLNLPDPHPQLYNRPEYSIRLANRDIWESNTGYNHLKHIAVISRQNQDSKPKKNSFRLRQRGK